MQSFNFFEQTSSMNVLFENLVIYPKTQLIIGKGEADINVIDYSILTMSSVFIFAKLESSIFRVDQNFNTIFFTDQYFVMAYDYDGSII